MGKYIKRRSQEESENIIREKCEKENYSFEPFIYKNKYTKIKFRCNKDGYEWETTFAPFTRLDSKCPMCSNKAKLGRPSGFNHVKSWISGEDRVEMKCKEYNYSLVQPFVYKNASSRIYLKCNKDGHEWNTIYNNFINNNTRCPICNGCFNFGNSKGEEKVKKYLLQKNVEFVIQKKFNDCRGIKNLMSFDFFLPNLNTCIEYDGEQHFKKFRFEKDDSKLHVRQNRDNIKTKYCENKSIKLIRIKYNENVEKILDETLN